jgi:4-hydroxybenzoyl-CoA thioesterase
VSEPFVHVHHVRFDEIDAAGIVYFANFFTWCHDAMAAMLAPLDGGYVGLVTRRRLGLPAVHVEADYVSPVRFGDEVRIATTVERIGVSSIALKFALTQGAGGAQGGAIATIRHVVVLSNLDELRSRPVPDDVRAVLEGHRESAALQAVAPAGSPGT